MHKELNPDLFGEARGNSSLKIDESFVVSPSRDPNLTIPSHVGSAPLTTDPTLFNTDKQLFDMRKQVSSVIEQLNKVILNLNESTKGNAQKFDRVQAATSRLEQGYSHLVQEVGQKFNLITSRLNERKVIDQKIQDMVDRHNNVIHNFEVRLGQVQKMLAEKEGQFHQAQAALNEAKMEISRLKRL